MKNFIQKIDLNTTILGLALISIFSIFVSGVFLFSLGNFSDIGTAFQPFMYRIGGGLVVFLVALVLIKKPIVHQKLFSLLFGLLVLIAQLLIIISFVRPVYTDTAYVMTMAGRLIEGNHTWYQYFYIYPNNVNVTIWWAVLLKPFHWIGMNNYLSIIPWIQMVMLDAGVIYLSLSLKKINVTFAKIFAFVSFIYVPLFMFVVFPYNDVIAIMLIMIVLGSFIRLQKSELKKTKMLNALLMAFAFALAVTLRQNSIIILMAFVFMLILSRSFTVKAKSLMIGLTIAFTLIGSMIAGGVQKNQGFVNHPSQVTPAVRYVNMSWNPNTSGQIDGPDSFLFAELPKKERTKKINSELKHRIKVLGITGIPLHITKKIAFMFSIGFPYQDLGGTYVKSPILQREWQTGPFFDILGNLFQPLYLFVLGMAGYALYTGVRRKNDYSNTERNLVVFSAFSILGVFTFHILLWEVRDRYALPMIPFILLLAVFGITRLAKNVNQTDKFKAVLTKKNVLTIVAILLLAGSFITGLSRFSKTVNHPGIVYKSGFSLYTEGQQELKKFEANSQYESAPFKLDSTATNFTFDLARAKKSDLKNLEIVLVNTDNGRKWSIPVSKNVNVNTEFPSGSYKLIVNNTSNHDIDSGMLQALDTNYIQGPIVKKNGQKLSGYNFIFEFTDNHPSTLISKQTYCFLYLPFLLISGFVFLYSRKRS